MWKPEQHVTFRALPLHLTLPSKWWLHVPVPVDISVNKDKYFGSIDGEKYVPELIFLLSKFGSNQIPSKNDNDHRVSENIIWEFHDLLIYLFTYLLTPWNRILPEQQTGFELVKRFLAFYGTRRFITPFTSARHLSYG
jgi:hypothetical protein